MTGREWIRDMAIKHGRDYVMQAYDEYKQQTGSTASPMNYNREVRRVLADIRKSIEPEYTPPSAAHHVKDLDTSAEFFNAPESTHQPKKITTNFWGNENNPNHQFKVEWKEREPEPLTPEKIAEVFLRQTESYQPPDIKNSPASMEGKTVIMSVPDLHVGKIIYGESTNTEDYNIERATELYQNAIKHFLSYITYGEVKKIILPVGEDFFNVDNLLRTTTKGTPQNNDDVYKTIEMGQAVVFSIIDTLIMYAPVHVVSVRGNHDNLLAFCMGLAIEQRYKDIDTFSIDNSSLKGKLVSSGNWAVRILHADNEKPESMAFSFATQEPEAWSASKYREILCGHFHHSKDMVRLGDSVQGVKIVFLPSLCPADYWHHARGFHSIQEAQMRVYDDEKGCEMVVNFRP